MKKQLCSRLSVRLSDGNLCVLLGLIGVGLEEASKHFSGDDLRQLVALHQKFSRKLYGTAAHDYSIVDGYVVYARNPQHKVARVGRRQFTRLNLALAHG